MEKGGGVKNDPKKSKIILYVVFFWPEKRNQKRLHDSMMGHFLKIFKALIPLCKKYWILRAICKWVIVSEAWKIHNQSTISNFTPVLPYGIRNHLTVCPVSSNFTIPAVGSQNVTSKSCLVCVKSEKYAFIRYMRQCKAELPTLYYLARRSQITYIKTHFSVSLHPQCQMNS